MFNDKLLIKAKKLVNSGRIESLGNGKFNVVGDHGTYLVIKNYDGTVSCNCIGFLRRKRCSHSIAVLFKNKSLRKRKTR
jgi:hypothetical protein